MRGKKAHKNTPVSDEPAIVVSGGKKRYLPSLPRITRKRALLIIVGIVILAVIVGTAVWYFLIREKLPNVTLDKDQEIASQVEVMSDQEQRSVAQKNVDATTDLEGTYAKGIALREQGKTKEAAEVLSSVADQSKATIDMRIDYVVTLAASGDFENAKRLGREIVKELVPNEKDLQSQSADWRAVMLDSKVNSW